MDDTTPTKVCSRCHRELPATREHFYAKKNGLYGLYSSCKRCHGDRCLANDRRYRATSEHYRQLQREAGRRFNKENPVARRAANHIRRARVANARGKFTAKDVTAKYAQQSGRCWWCGKSLADGYHADHLVPLAKGGSNAATNIVLACPTCNRSKHAKMPYQFNGRLL
jgi:5-methylcytosine-specific restriction endonuclease McrA